MAQVNRLKISPKPGFRPPPRTGRVVGLRPSANGVIKALRHREQEAKAELPVVVAVGYTAAYAIYVHENLESSHAVGQAKFLEEPARKLMRILGELIRDSMKAGLSLVEAMLGAGLRLQRESQQLCPVDTGALKASAFTRLE
jgi:hypothetical protein